MEQTKNKRTALSYCVELIETAKEMYPDEMAEVIATVHIRMQDEKVIWNGR